MVYDPSAKARSASGVFPLGFPFTTTSASAGVDRTSTLPVCAFGMGLSAVAICEGGAEGEASAVVGAGVEGAGAGKSTIVASTPLVGSAVGTGLGDRRKNPTDNAARIAKTRNIATIGHRRLGSGSTSLVCSARGGCGDHDGGKAGDGGAGSRSTLKTGGSSRSRSCEVPRSMTRSKGSSRGAWAGGKVGTTVASAIGVSVSYPVLAFRPVLPVSYVALAFRPAPARSAAAKSPARCGRNLNARPSSVP
jgi:hypothetical protein